MSLINRLKPLALGLILSATTITAFSRCETLKPESNNEKADHIFKKRIYITAFGPFKDYQRNPTQEIADYFSQKGYSTEVLEVDYHKAPERLRQIIANDKPDVIISLGFSKNISRLTLSATAKNVMSSDSPDNSGRIHENVKINDKLPETLLINRQQFKSFTKKAKEAKIDYFIEFNSDTFVCNSLSFAGIAETKRNDKTLFYFFHVPQDIYSNPRQLENLEKLIQMLGG